MTGERYRPSSEACPHCRGTDLHSYTVRSNDDQAPVDIRIHVCNACTFAWQWPWHRSELTSFDYFETAYETASDGTYFDSENRQKIANLQFDHVLSRLSGSRTLLDVGGGDGVFAQTAAAAGWAVTCLDPALPDERLSDGNPRLIRGLLDDLAPSETFEVATLWDVIEHLESPSAVVSAVVERLAPGGMLFVETGNFQSAGRIEGGPDWWCYQSDHRWYFTPPVVSAIMAEAGLTDVTVHDRVLRPWWKGRKSAPVPTVFDTVRRSVKRPHRIPAHLKRYRELAFCARNWPDWSGLEIFVASGRRAP